jgi:D-glycero-D-manno-heptose 1,7-bisphosphate phosphatase
MSRRGVFLDLNGTLVLPAAPAPLSEYRPIGNASQAVGYLCRGRFCLPGRDRTVRNCQGTVTETAFREWFESFKRELAIRGAVVEGPYVCPHRSVEACACKKTGGELYRRAAADFGLTVGMSFVVGDTLEDMEAAALLECPGVLVRTGSPVDSNVEVRATHVPDDILAAARWIVLQSRVTVTP